MRAAIFGLAAALAACVEHGSQPDDDVDPPPPGSDALARYSSCMSLQSFQTANMGKAWRSLGCGSCHQQGQFGFVGTDTDAEFFDAISQHRHALLLFVQVDQDRVIVNETTLPQLTSAEHPHMGIGNVDPGMTALRQFHALTTSALDATGAVGCGPSKLVD